MNARGIGLLVLALALAGCADAGPREGSGRYEPAGIEVEGTGYAVAQVGKVPRFCSSFPPSRTVLSAASCTGLPLRNFVPAALPDAVVGLDATWVRVTLRGTFRDGVLTVRSWRAPMPRRDLDPVPQFTDEELNRVWAVQLDPAATALATWAETQPESAGVWWDRRIRLVLAFTGEVERLEREARARWGGPIRVIERPWREQDLEDLHRRLAADPRFSGNLTSRGGDDLMTGSVRLGVVLADERTRAIVDEIRGPDGPPVHLDPFLRPV